VYMEFEEPVSMTSVAVRETFGKINLKARFVGAVSNDMRPKSKTQRLRV
jgi:hypothetical protein